MDKKTHAKDYLLEYSKGKPEWLKVLIEESIETNGAISEERQNEIFECLVNGTSITKQVTHSMAECSTHPTADSSSDEKLIFKKLTHKCGVNALCENQTIKFSKDVTVLYGLNGSGKSSYFRILNEVVGGNQEKKILPNIYKSDNKDVNVLIEYETGEKQKETLTFDNKQRAITDFKNVKVFDSSYLNGLLESRTPDATLVFPLGLHLFSYIAYIMDLYSTKLNQCAEAEKIKLPAVNTENFQENIKTKFNMREYFKDCEKTAIEGKYIFSEEDKILLGQNENELKQLNQTNYEDKIKLLSNENNVLSAFISNINNITEAIKNYSNELRVCLDNYNGTKVKNDNARKQSEIISRLPKSDTPEWKSFIKAGQEYSALLNGEEIEKCPYCHQELKTEKSVNIIRAYSTFLFDASEKELKSAEQKLNEIRNKIEKLDVEITIPEEIRTIIDCLTDLQEKIDQLSTCKKMLQLAGKADDIQDIILDFSIEIESLKEKQNKNNEQLENFKLSNSEKDNKISKLQESIARLKENKSISEQQEIIKKYFLVYEKVRKYEDKKENINTRSLTSIARQAQNELLTETLKREFEKELKFLGRDTLKVILEVTNASKGKCQTELKLVHNNSLKNILSEGEQKAVGLAMFFAEIQNKSSPIILDDPVTSLDHEIAGMLATRLLQFDNQIIVFCHNRLFLDGFETSKENHVCKDFNSCCNNKGKHIQIYQIYADGTEKGILSNYKADNSDTLLKDAQDKMSVRPFQDSLSVSMLLRRAVEKIIDEKVFRNQLPPKVSNKNSRINWNELKSINTCPQLIGKLRTVHDVVSDENHDGTASRENPISLEKLRGLAEELKNIKNEFDDMK